MSQLACTSLEGGLARGAHNEGDAQRPPVGHKCQLNAPWPLRPADVLLCTGGAGLNCEPVWQVGLYVHR